MLEVRNLGLERVLEIIPKRFGDDRGFFSETYNKKQFAEIGVDVDFIQDNFSFSKPRGTLRGLHFQKVPFAQAKLVKVISGSIFDVAVDIRPDSADFGKWVSVTLTAETGNQIFIPAGFAHGFVTLEENTQVSYKVDNYYSPEHDRSIRFNDPQLGIKWPISEDRLTLSQKDMAAQNMSDLD